jgi:hypothetical protein
MSKKNAKARSDRLFHSLKRISLPQPHTGAEQDELLDLQSIHGQMLHVAPDSSRSPRMKKFRFQLLHQWLVARFEPCRAADIGGGKGLVSYLLACSGWQPVVIDPFQQPLPDKYKDIPSGARVKISSGTEVPCLAAPFEPELAKNFDLLIGMHAHGCNVKIIDAAAEYGCGFVLFPCCVIDEPFYPPLGVHWLESLADYAVRKGHAIRPFRLNFKGQNIGFYTPGRCIERDLCYTSPE